MILSSQKSRSNWAVIVAAGSGTRLGGDSPKQFIRLADRELMSFSVDTFLNHPAIDHVVIVTTAAFLYLVRKSYPACTVVVGGETRQESSANGVAACQTDATKILIHDAARPFVTPQTISECLAALDENDAAAPVSPTKDTIVKQEGSTWRQLDRSQLRAMQTPQGFRAEVIRSAHATGVIGTDEIGLVLVSNPQAKIHLFEGDLDNFKITTRQDLELAKLALARRQTN